MRYIFYLLCLLIAGACGPDFSHENERTGSAWEGAISERSPKEEKFIDSLATLGYTVSIEHEVTGRQTDGLRYRFKISNDTVRIDSSNYTSFILLREDIMRNLCTNVIDDSLIYDLDKLEFLFNYHIDKSIVLMKGEDAGSAFKPFRRFTKEEIENLYGFKVVEDGKGGFKRVKI